MVRHAAILCALAALPGLAHATPPDTVGFGSRSTALGGAVTAGVSDFSANYYNPAGLTRAPGLQIAAGYLSVVPTLRLNGVDSDVERHGAMLFGLVAPATFGRVRIAFGLGIHLPDQRVARTRSSVVDRPRWELYDTRAHRLYLSTNLAIQPFPWLSIGGGITFQSPSELTLDIRGTANVLMPEQRSRLQHQFKGDLTSVRYPTAGIQIRPHERISIGLVYRGQVELRNTIIALADANVAPFDIPLSFSLISAATSLFGPQQASLGFEVRPIDRLRLMFELTWYDWSKHSSLLADQDIVLRVEPPPGLDLDIPDEITSLPPLPLNLHDTFVPRLGVEYAAVQGDIGLDLRVGYVYENSPFPTQRGITNFVDNDRHSISAGVGVQFNDLEPTLPGALRFDAHFVYAHLRGRDHIKTSLVDPVGDYRSTGHLLGGGVTMELAFE